MISFNEWLDKRVLSEAGVEAPVRTKPEPGTKKPLGPSHQPKKPKVAPRPKAPYEGEKEKG
jgi:hypothetical protein